MPQSLDALENRSEICKVCGAALDLVKEPIIFKTGDDYLSFCTEKCHKDYLEDPEKYSLIEEELE